jgi:hypothetical protein
MQRWEYLYVVYVLGRGDALRVYRVQDRMIRDGPLVHDYVDQLGQEGWELVGIDQGTLWFKRRLGGETGEPAPSRSTPPRMGTPPRWQD